MWPAGVCIQELAAIIQKAEIQVPTATTTVAIKCSLGPTRCQPNSIMPKKPASRKNAVSTSYAISGPSTAPVMRENSEKLVPNSYDSTMPDTTPIPKVIAKG